MKTSIEFIKKNWFIILPWFLAITFFVHILIKRETVRPITPPNDNRIDSLQQVVNYLNLSYNKLKHDYDSTQANVTTEIKYIQIKNAKDISNIRSYTTSQRDSMWATLKP